MILAIQVFAACLTLRPSHPQGRSPKPIKYFTCQSIPTTLFYLVGLKLSLHRCRCWLEDWMLPKRTWIAVGLCFCKDACMQLGAPRVWATQHPTGRIPLRCVFFSSPKSLLWFASDDRCGSDTRPYSAGKRICREREPPGGEMPEVENGSWFAAAGDVSCARCGASELCGERAGDGQQAEFVHQPHTMRALGYLSILFALPHGWLPACFTES